MTPEALLQWSAVGCEGSKEDWLVRVFPNKFPAFEPEMPIIGDPNIKTEPSKSPHATSSSTSPHLQEVVVLSPRHIASLSGLSDDELSISFAVSQNRVRAHWTQAGIAHVCLFMNCRPLAGASIEHSHFQLIASPVCTSQVRDRVQRMSQSAEDSNGQTVWQLHLQQEHETAVRVVEQTDDFLVYCPFASRYSNQIRIAPLNQIGPFVELESAKLWQLAQLCRHWVDGIQRCLIDDVAYNLIFHLPPTTSRLPIGLLTWYRDSTGSRAGASNPIAG